MSKWIRTISVTGSPFDTPLGKIVENLPNKDQGHNLVLFIPHSTAIVTMGFYFLDDKLFVARNAKDKSEGFNYKDVFFWKYLDEMD